MVMNFRTFLAVSFAAFFLPRLFASDFSQRLEWNLLATQFSLRGAQETPRAVTIVEIDPRSHRRLGFSRTEGLGLDNLARAIDRIADARPKLLVLDLYFSRLSQSEEINQQLYRALRRVPTVIARGITRLVDRDVHGTPRFDLDRTIPPADLRQNVAATVLMMLSTTADDAATGIHLASGDDALLDAIPLLDPLRRFVSPHIEQPGEHDLIDFYGPAGSIPNLPIYKLLAPGENAPEEYFRDRVVFIGAVGMPDANPNGGDDSFLTPLGTRMYGVEVHATITQNLLDGRWIRRLPLDWEACAQMAVGGLYCMFLPTIGRRRAWPTAGGLAVAWAAAAYCLFSFQRFFIPGLTLFALVLPAITLAFTMLSRGAAGKTESQHDSSE